MPVPACFVLNLLIGRVGGPKSHAVDVGWRQLYCVEIRAANALVIRVRWEPKNKVRIHRWKSEEVGLIRIRRLRLLGPRLDDSRSWGMRFGLENTRDNLSRASEHEQQIEELRR